MKNNSHVFDVLDINKHNLLIIYKNAIVYYIDSLHRVEEKIERISKIIDTINIHKNLDIDTKNIPKNLQFLIPYLSEWAISDNFLRQEKISTINSKDKYELLEKIYPFVNEINKYISKYENSNNEVLLLGYLAEFISELHNTQ